MAASYREIGRSGAILVALTAISLFGAPAASAHKSYECQHPTVTGEEATDLKHVGPTKACAAVRQLSSFIEGGERSRRLYRCVGLTASHPGKPVLVIDRLDGWSLRISHEYEFVMFSGASSFHVIGTDFPLNCT